jgi:hypothetical protein
MAIPPGRHLEPNEILSMTSSGGMGSLGIQQNMQHASGFRLILTW